MKTGEQPSFRFIPVKASDRVYSTKSFETAS
jgi:hypothetical protein